MKKRVSYSQYSTWLQCPFRYKLVYIDGNYEKSYGINLVFGNAMHLTIQTYVNLIYTVGPSRADELDLNNLLFENMMKDFKQNEEENKKAITSKELVEYHHDGCQILDWIKKHRVELFVSRGWKLEGIELPLRVDVLDDKVEFEAFLDIVLRKSNLNVLKIIDLKTSRSGWNPDAKKDPVKNSQLQLYKHYLSKIYNVPIENIEIEFVILKRKLLKNWAYPVKQKRVQKHSPSSGKVTLNKVSKSFNEFIETVFKDDGTRDGDKFYPKVPTDSNCRFCPFNNRPDLCDKTI